MVNNKFYHLFSVYLLGFLFAFHIALPTFINSSFLNLFISEQLLSLVYITAALLTIFFLNIIPVVVRKIGNYHLALTLILLEIIALLGLILSQNPYLLAGFFILSLIVISLFYFSLDLFLEGFSADKKTGKIRGAYLTLGNLAWIFSPIIAGFILTNGDYWKIYFTSLIFLIPIFLILFFNLRKFLDSKYQVVSLFETIKQIRHNKDINNIFWTNFLLNFFYSWMTIYTPIYLHKYIGFSWEQIGLIFGVMLIPFVLVQFPLGKIADERLGEKEILCIGLIIMSLATASLFFVPSSSSLWIWALLLFATRIGASSVEVMSNTYFFKKVNMTNTNFIGFFRMSYPLAYIVGPLVLTISLNFLGSGSRYIFLVLSIIVLMGLYFSLRLKDTK